MQKIIKNISMAIAISVVLAGCQTMSKQGSSTNNSTLGTLFPVKSKSARQMVSGKKNFREANYGMAEKDFRKMVELHPTNAEAWLGLAASYDQLGMFARSDRAYKKAIMIVGPKPAILNNQGYSQMLRGNKKQAGKLLKKAAKMDPDNARIKGNLELLRKA